MTVSITVYGDNNYYNASPWDSNASTPSQVYVETNSTATVLNAYLYLPEGLATLVTQGNFQYDGDPSTMAHVSGTINSITFSLNGVLMERDTFTQPADLQQWCFSSLTQANYVYEANILYQGINFVGSTAARAQNGDVLIGGGGQDRFTSYAGMVANGGAAYFDGKGGLDTAVFQGKQIEYDVLAQSFTDWTDMTNTRQVSGYEVIDSIKNRNGYSLLVNTERLSFSDTMVALDTGANQTAGNAYLLYQAAFNRTPDTPGLGYWIAQMDKGANVVTQVAENFILGNEFKSLYGASPTVDQFTNLLYVNVLHRSADAAGLKYWEDQFAGTGFNLLTQAQTLNNFAISNENQANAATQIAHGIHYQAYVG